MPTTGTYAFSLDADELTTEAWERCGRDAAQLTDVHARSALRSLQLTLLGWTNAGLNLWQMDRQTVAVEAGEDSVTTAAATAAVLEAVVTVGGRDTPLAAIGRAEWMALPDKAQTGSPTMYWVERINLVPVIHLYPVPAAAVTLTYSRVRLPQDVGTLGHTPDVPTLWLDAVAAELARRLAVKYAPDRLPVLTPEAVAAFEAAAAENRERVPLRLAPRLG